jgi:hypothetical protein
VARTRIKDHAMRACDPSRYTSLMPSARIVLPLVAVFWFVVAVIAFSTVR